MASIDDQLFVFTKNTILKVVQDETLDIKIEKLNFPVSIVMEKSVGKAGSYIIFASNEELYKWLKNFYNRFFAQQFKRSCLPDGVKVGSVGFSPRGDFAMPSDAFKTEWIKDLENIKV